MNRTSSNIATVDFYLDPIRLQRGQQLARVAREQEINDAIHAARLDGHTPSRTGVIRAARNAGIRVEGVR